MKTIYKLISAITLLGIGFNSNAQVATNYTFSQTNGTFTPITGGTVVGGPTDDDYAYGDLQIGFQFKYNGACYSTFGMSSNGSFVFGLSYPNSEYHVLSSGYDNNIIALLNNDTKLGTFAQSTVVIGSPTVAVLSSLGIAVGNVLSTSSGFPYGTTVTAVSSTGFTVSTVATSNYIGLIGFANGEMRYQTLGSAPNRTLVAQWLNERPYSNYVSNESYNYQLRLEEATNKISIVYGAFSSGSNYHDYQVGLRGNNNSDFNNRTSLTNWSATTAGLVNSDYCVVISTLTPVSGLTFNWNTNISVPSPSVTLSITGNTLNCGVSSATNILSASGASSYSWSTGSSAPSIFPTTNTTTIYTVIGTGTNGCTNTKSIYIVVGPNPSITISGTSSVCVGQAITLSASGATTYSWNTGALTASIAASPSATSLYSVVGTSSLGCSNSAIQTVSVFQLPSLVVLSSDPILCIGETVSLTVSGATSYSWSTAATNSVIVISPTVNSTYSVSGSNECASTAVFTQSVEACTGILQLAGGSLRLAVYPNPNIGEFTIETPQELNITVFNSLGQIVLQQNLTEGKNNIDLTNQAKGIYVIQLNQNGNVNTSKIIKE